MSTCKTTDFHTAHLTVWGHLAYGTPLPLWRVIPHRWLTRPCPGQAHPSADGVTGTSTVGANPTKPGQPGKPTSGAISPPHTPFDPPRPRNYRPYA